MYHYFKGVSETAPNKVVVDLKSEINKTSNQSKPFSPKSSPTLVNKKVPEYMEMTSNSSSGSEKEPYEPVNAVSNLNYINVESHQAEDSIDECDGLRSMRVTEAETTNELKITEPAYYESKDSNKTDTFSLECSNLLENVEKRQAELMADYMIQPSNRPVTSDGFGDYLTHPSNKPVYSSDNCYMNADVSKDDSHMKLSFAKKKKKAGKEEAGCSGSVKANTLKRQGSDSSKISVDDELLEIINDFKNNVFSINEVEQLVSTWRNRNDVQQSFKDKQDQLQRMRDEYERLQHQMKEDLKRPTPFERMKKLFTRNKSVDKENLAEEEISLNPNYQRPASTLSLQSVSSSSSCGRLSTGSVCSGTSLGDSGTHSDHEDRRQNFPGNCRIGTPGSLLLDNYMVPPAPRPVITPVSTPTPVEERFSGPNEHYIIFPSNAPVFSQHHDYINFNNSLNTIDETKETTDVTVQPIKIQKTNQEPIYGPMSPLQNLCTSFRSHCHSAETIQYGTVKPGEDIELKNLLMQNNFVKTESKGISRQHSDESNSTQSEHNYINLSV